MSFEKYLQKQGKSKSTIKHYNSYILDFLSWLDIDGTEIENATAKEVLSYLNHLQRPVRLGGKGQENKTRNIRLNVIKQFFNWQIDRNHRADNPIQHLKIRGSKTKKLYQLLDKQQLESLYNEYEVPVENDERSNRNWFRKYRLSKARNKAILSLLINQGITTPEVEKLTVSDLETKGRKNLHSREQEKQRTDFRVEIQPDHRADGIRLAGEAIIYSLPGRSGDKTTVFIRTKRWTTKGQ